jgi:hypothetical protein
MTRPTSVACAVSRAFARTSPAQQRILRALFSGTASVMDPGIPGSMRLYQRNALPALVRRTTVMRLVELGFMERYHRDRELSPGWRLTPDGEAYCSLMFT